MGRFACVVFNCNMRTYNMTPEQKKLSSSEYLVSFHKFPSDLKRQKLWTTALGNEDWIPSTESVVCSLHFGSDCYDENNKLRDTAVPSIVFDDFNDHLKLILDTIEKEKTGEINLEDQNSRNKEPEASGGDESEMSDSDFEIECEEILLSDESDDEDADEIDETSISIEQESQDPEPPTKLPQPSPKPVISRTVSKPVSKTKSSSTSSISTPPIKAKSVSSISASPKSAIKPSAVTPKTIEAPAEVTVEDDVPATNSSNSTNENIVIAKHDASSNSGVSTFPKLHKIPSKEDTSEQARQLYSMIQSGSFKNFSVMQPASKNLVHQLLEIVKLANSRNQPSSNGDENIPNTYIITTKYDDPNSTGKVRIVETNEVISMIQKTVLAIKDGTYEKNDDLVIICGSPAIFLIKNVSVKTFDPNMNSVYVITTENLISYLYLLSTKAKPVRKIPLKADSAQIPTSTNATSMLSSSVLKVSSKNVRVPFSSLGTKIIPQKFLSPSNSSSFLPVASTSSTSSLKPIASATISQNTLGGISSASSVPAEITRPVQSLPLSKVVTQSVPLLSHPVAIGVTTNSVTNLTTSPSSSLLVNPLSGTTSIVIPSKSSAFQAPKVAIAPLNAMRNNMASYKRKIDAIHKPNSPAPSKDGAPGKAVPSLVVTQSSASSNITLPREVSATLNRTGVVKLTFAPATSSTSTPLQPLKPLQPTEKKRLVLLEPNKWGLKFDTISQKRKTTDFVAIEPSPKRSPVGIENKTTTDSSSKFKSNVGPSIPKPISPIRTESPEAPSPIGDDNVGSDSEEERPLSPRAAQRLLATQRTQIRTLEQNIIKREREILALRKKIPVLKKRCLAAKKTTDSKPDEQLVEDILKKYLDNDAVQFFIGQLKMAGKSFTQFRWTEDDKLFALGLLYRNPVEYNVLVQRFTLPSDKTLNKFVSRIKKAEMDANVTS